ncbi:MAG: hypothetical protein LBV45_03405 [Xanthomonadaceae bacterium]|jgi:cytochrome bd-type quinol oxidase subunit 1|nr:hypothetical protein [Xanthomonadaceae bacterium]
MKGIGNKPEEPGRTRRKPDGMEIHRRHDMAMQPLKTNFSKLTAQKNAWAHALYFLPAELLPRPLLHYSISAYAYFTTKKIKQAHDF